MKTIRSLLLLAAALPLAACQTIGWPHPPPKPRPAKVTMKVWGTASEVKVAYGPATHVRQMKKPRTVPWVKHTTVPAGVTTFEYYAMLPKHAEGDLSCSIQVGKVTNTSVESHDVCGGRIDRTPTGGWV